MCVTEYSCVAALCQRASLHCTCAGCGKLLCQSWTPIWCKKELHDKSFALPTLAVTLRTQGEVMATRITPPNRQTKMILHLDRNVYNTKWEVPEEIASNHLVLFPEVNVLSGGWFPAYVQRKPQLWDWHHCFGLGRSRILFAARAVVASDGSFQEFVSPPPKKLLEQQFCATHVACRLKTGGFWFDLPSEHIWRKRNVPCPWNRCNCALIMDTKLTTINFCLPCSLFSGTFALTTCFCRAHWGWGCLRTGCWGEYLGLGGTG